MKNKIIILLLLVTNLFGYDWIDYNNSKINSKVIVVKIKKQDAPLLGIEAPLKLNEVSDLYDKLKELDIIDFTPLFSNYQNFSPSHYDFNLHQYYRVDFKNKIDFQLIEKELKNISIIELIERAISLKKISRLVLYESSAVLSPDVIPIRNSSLNFFI